jgi:hypothetical protein
MQAKDWEENRRDSSFHSSAEVLQWMIRDTTDSEIELSNQASRSWSWQNQILKSEEVESDGATRDPSR